jgi:hypothetical protein
MIQGLQTGGNMGRKPRVDRSPEEKWQIVQEPLAVKAEVPRKKPGREKGRSTSSSLAGFAASSNFSISKRVGLRIGSTFGLFGFTARRA